MGVRFIMGRIACAPILQVTAAEQWLGLFTSFLTPEKRKVAHLNLSQDRTHHFLFSLQFQEGVQGRECMKGQTNDDDLGRSNNDTSRGEKKKKLKKENV